MKNIKKFIAAVLSLILLLSIMGCGSQSSVDLSEDTTDIENSDNLKEDIIGSWNAGTSYMCFFDNGEVGIFSSSSGKSDILQYEIDGDTIIIDLRSEKRVFTSAEVKNGTLTFLNEDGNVNKWASVPNEEVNEILEQMK